MEAGVQILKCRDDKAPISFRQVTSPTPADGSSECFHLPEGAGCSWIPGGTLNSGDLRKRIEPWLTTLFQSEHLALLVGSGLTHAVHHIASDDALPGMTPARFSHYEAEISAEAKRLAEAAGRGPGNIEDQIRAATELLRGLEILATGDKELLSRANDLRQGLERVLGDFAASILKGEEELVKCPDAGRRENAFNYLVSFLMSFASRTGTRDRLQIFTTNYDRFLEAGAEVAGLRLLDRFVGSLAPVFRSSRVEVDMHYNPPGIRGEPRYLEGVARFTKLHGSVDWVDTGKSIRRIGLALGAASIGPYLDAPGLGAQTLQLMIYPNSAKDRETAAYPYVDLFRDFAAAVSRPNSTLVCFGYSFGDEHINRVVEDMLTIPSTHLVIISYGDPLGRIMQTYQKLGRNAQVTLLLGDHLGNLTTLVDNYLPKPAIDRNTFRMAELLRSRWTSGAEEPGADGNGPAGTGGSPQ